MIEWRIERFPILASTNDLALERMRSGSARAGDVLIAEEQLAGRGRPGRTWHSPRGALLMTAVLPFQPARVGWTALAAGAATASAVRDLGAEAGVKWPNDVLLAGRKLAGVLAETSVANLVAVGIGMNVSNPPPEDPALAARSVRLADCVAEIRPEAILSALLTRLDEFWTLLFAPNLVPLRATWEALDTTRGRRVRWIGMDQATARTPRYQEEVGTSAIDGTAGGIDEAGALLIHTADSRQLAAAVGEVVFI